MVSSTYWFHVTLYERTSSGVTSPSSPVGARHANCGRRRNATRRRRAPRPIHERPARLRGQLGLTDGVERGLDLIADGLEERDVETGAAVATAHRGRAVRAPLGTPPGVRERARDVRGILRVARAARAGAAAVERVAEGRERCVASDRACLRAHLLQPRHERRRTADAAARIVLGIVGDSVLDVLPHGLERLALSDRLREKLFVRRRLTQARRRSTDADEVSAFEARGADALVRIDDPGAGGLVDTTDLELGRGVHRNPRARVVLRLQVHMGRSTRGLLVARAHNLNGDADGEQACADRNGRIITVAAHDAEPMIVQAERLHGARHELGLYRIADVRNLLPVGVENDLHLLARAGWAPCLGELLRRPRPYTRIVARRPHLLRDFVEAHHGAPGSAGVRLHDDRFFELSLRHGEVPRLRARRSTRPLREEPRP